MSIGRGSVGREERDSTVAGVKKQRRAFHRQKHLPFVYLIVIDKRRQMMKRPEYQTFIPISGSQVAGLWGEGGGIRNEGRRQREFD